MHSIDYINGPGKVGGGGGGHHCVWFPPHVTSLSPLQVVEGDKVILMQVNSGQMLHVSDLSLIDHPECREVNADPIGSSWKICLFMKQEEDKLDVIKGVCHVTWFCIEIRDTSYKETRTAHLENRRSCR